MRILTLCHTFPYPTDDGSRVAIWNTSVALASSNEVHLVTTEQGETARMPRCKNLEVEVVPLPHASGLGARIRRLGRSLRSGVPASVLAETSAAMVSRANQIAGSGWPDVVIAQENSTGVELRGIVGPVPRVWVKHSVFARDVEEWATRTRSIRARVEVAVTRRYERACIDAADLVITLTEEDADELRRRYGERRIRVIPNGIDHHLFSNRPDPGTQIVAFVGSYAWGPNVDAAAWFAGEIWPQVRTRVPTAELRLIGTHLNSTLAAKFAGPGVQPVGYVDDLAAALRDVSVAVAPVRLGSGIRCKLLDSLAMGIASVTTSLGHRGLPISPGRDCLVADDAQAFAVAVVRLLEDPDERRAIGRCGHEAVASMTWERSASMVEDALHELVGDPDPR